MRALELEVWIGDDGLVGKIRFDYKLTRLTLDLLGFGVTEPLDWSRLPSVERTA